MFLSVKEVTKGHLVLNHGLFYLGWKFGWKYMLTIFQVERKTFSLDSWMVSVVDLVQNVSFLQTSTRWRQHGQSKWAIPREETVLTVNVSNMYGTSALIWQCFDWICSDGMYTKYIWINNELAVDIFFNNLYIRRTI